jgi:hypothetical protein
MPQEAVQDSLSTETHATTSGNLEPHGIPAFLDTNTRVLTQAFQTFNANMSPKVASLTIGCSEDSRVKTTTHMNETQQTSGLTPVLL